MEEVYERTFVSARGTPTTRQSRMAHRDDDSPLVRPPRLTDAERIADLHVRSWQVAYRGLFPDRYLNGLSFEMASRTEQ